MESRPDYKKFHGFVSRWEGGLSKHKADGARNQGTVKGDYHTNRGITWATYQALVETVLGNPPSEDQFLNLTDEEGGLFLKHYWDKATANNSIDSQRVAEAMTSWLWGSGIRGGAKRLQRFYNRQFENVLTVDGIIGKKTASAFNQVNHIEMFNELCDAREEFFKKLVERKESYKVFLKGWLNRLNDLRERWN